MGQNFFINLPSSGGGDPSAAYLLVSGSDPGGQLTAYRTITAGPNIALIDGGALGTLQISGSGVQGNPGTNGSQGPSGSTGKNGTASWTLIQQQGNTAVTFAAQFGITFMSTSVGQLSASLPNPSGSAGQWIGFKDCQGSSSLNPFIVFPIAGALIDTLSSSYQYYVNFGCLKFFTDGANWFTF